MMQSLIARQFAECGYSDWDLPAEPRLDPAFGSGYVRRLAAEAMAVRNQTATTAAVSKPRPARFHQPVSTRNAAIGKQAIGGDAASRITL
ncbi:MAG: hypothetical protein ACLQHK_03685 [Gallionellaceae bacterium]